MSFRLRLGLFLVALSVSIGLPLTGSALPGTVLVTLESMAPVRAGEVFRVTLRMTEYTEPIEIDGFRFNVSFPTNLTFVQGSGRLTDDFGTDQPWLSKANQETPAQGYQPVSSSQLVEPTRLDVHVRDTGTGPIERGTIGFAGFLYSFQLRAQSEGTSLIRSFAYDGPGGPEALYATTGAQVEVPSFGAAVKVVEPGINVSVTRSGTNAVLRWPTSPAGFFLQQKLDLTPATTWVNVTAPVVQVQGQNQVTLPAVGPQRFFRLRN